MRTLLAALLLGQTLTLPTYEYYWKARQGALRDAESAACLQGRTEKCVARYEKFLAAQSGLAEVVPAAALSCPDAQLLANCAATCAGGMRKFEKTQAGFTCECK